jgi:hypothetical protein
MYTIHNMIGILLIAGANEMFDFRGQRNADNLQVIADHARAQTKRDAERTKMRRFLVERGLEADDEVLARMGL